MLIWGEVTPELLSRVSAAPALVELMSKVLDSMYIASMPAEAHVEHLINRINRVRAVRPSLRTCPDIVGDPDRYFNYLWDAIDFLQMHQL